MSSPSPLWLVRFAILALFVSTTVYAACDHTSHYTLNLAAKEISPDGFRRTAALVNGTFPGPVLTATKGEQLTVQVLNHLADKTMRQSTSIHWHGIFQSRNAENDGPSFVTQCPISPNHSYTYAIDTGTQAGTFWYHSHLGTQYVDGIRGALIIYDPDEPYRYMYDVDDLSTIITLSDWYHGKAEAMLASWRNNGSEPVPDSGLINGIGRYEGGPLVKRARMNVVYGKRYRFRIISMSANGFFDVAISSHSMTVIEADGIIHKPYCVDSITVSPGQRYSVVVTADKAVANYWIRATHTVRGGETSSPENHNFNGNDTYAVLHYQGAPNADPQDAKPTILPPGGIPLEEYKLTPLEDSGLPKVDSPSDLHVFNFSYNIGSPNADIWTVNNVAYKSPSVPILLNILANGFTNASQFAADTNTVIIPRNATIEIFFNGLPPIPGAGHSFHLHGHAFDVVQSASGPPNYVNPPRRDTVISGNNPVRVRFRSDNPGPWLVHCHIDWHLEAGLGAVLVEDPQGIRSGPQSVKPNAAWEELCSIYDKLDPSQQ